MNGLVDFIAANAGRYVSLAELQSRALEVALTHYLFGGVPTPNALLAISMPNIWWTRRHHGWQTPGGTAPLMPNAMR
jgi:hypothetical protein